MRFISTGTHAVLDYVVGLVLIAAPWIFGFATGGPAQWVPVVLGIGMLGMALLTRYEYGLFGVVPMPFHLGVDFIAGALLAVSPWLFNFADTVFWPHLILGLFEMGAAVTTQTRSSVPGGGRSY